MKMKKLLTVTLLLILIISLLYLINKIYPLTYLIYIPLLQLSDNFINLSNEINNYLNNYNILNNDKTITNIIKNNQELNIDLLNTEKSKDNKTMIISLIVCFLCVFTINKGYIDFNHEHLLELIIDINNLQNMIDLQNNHLNNIAELIDNFNIRN
jgi:hypothetical protein